MLMNPSDDNPIFLPICGVKRALDNGLYSKRDYYKEDLHVVEKNRGCFLW